MPWRLISKARGALRGGGVRLSWIVCDMKRHSASAPPSPVIGWNMSLRNKPVDHALVIKNSNSGLPVGENSVSVRREMPHFRGFEWVEK